MSNYAQKKYPKCWFDTLPGGEYDDIVFDTLCTSIIIENQSDHQLIIRLNGDTDARFELAANSSINFADGDLHLTEVRIDNTASGATSADYQVIAGLVK